MSHEKIPLCKLGIIESIDGILKECFLLEDPRLCLHFNQTRVSKLKDQSHFFYYTRYY